MRSARVPDRLVAALVTCSAPVALALTARAQAGPPLVTDDPGTPGAGRFEINLAATRERLGRTSTYEAPLLDVNYGLGSRVQLKYEVPWVFVDAERDADGLGNSLLGVKWRFLDEDDGGLAMSVYPQVELENPGSSSARRDVVDRGPALLLPLEVAHDFGPCEAVLEVGYVVQDQGADGWFGGVAFARPLTDDVDLLAEVHTEAGHALESSTGSWNVGTRMSLGDPLTLLAAVGNGLWSSGDEDTPGSRVFLGLQFAW